MTRQNLIDNRPEIKGSKLIIGYLGIFLILIGLICLLPLIMLIFYPSEWVDMFSFIIPGLSSIVVGSLLTLIFKGRKKGRLQRKHGVFLVVAIWILAILITAIPYSIGRNNVFLNYAQAIFETTSGFSTTGLTMVSKPEDLGHVFLFHRSLTIFFGGVGLVLVLTSAISDQFSLSLYYAEGHSDQLLPNLVKSARVIMGIYIAYISLGTLSYTLFGMEPFDALNHSICAVGTGGFSTKSENIGYYLKDGLSNNMIGLPVNFVGIEITTIILMILGASSFMFHLYLFQRKFKKAFNSFEVKTYICEFLILMPIIFGITFSSYSVNVLHLSGVDAFFNAFRTSLFHFTSAATGTGYSTLSMASVDVVGSVSATNYYSSSIMFILVLAMLIGGHTNSTCGGFKQNRLGLFFIGIYWSIRDMLSRPNTIRSNYIYRYGERCNIDDKELKQTYIFVASYITLFIVGTLIFMCFGYNAIDSMFEFASALSTTGLSVGITSNLMHPALLWTETLGMFLGRLEIFIVIVFFAKIFDFKGRNV